MSLEEKRKEIQRRKILWRERKAGAKKTVCDENFFRILECLEEQNKSTLPDLTDFKDGFIVEVEVKEGE